MSHVLRSCLGLCKQDLALLSAKTVVCTCVFSVERQQSVSSLTPLVFTYAYVTYQDIKQVGNLKDQTVIVVKAPTETKLEVPDPDEVHEHILFGVGSDLFQGLRS